MAATLRSLDVNDQVVHLDLTWDAYEVFAASLGDERNARLTFNVATLEIMAPGFRHEAMTARVTELLLHVKAEWRIAMRSTRSARFQNPFSKSGFEADESFYVASIPKIRDWNNIDLGAYPPPDLVIEIDISGKRRNKEIYERVGVPEFWRYSDERGLEAFALASEKFVPITVSRVLPTLPIAEVAERLTDESQSMEDLDAWRAWLRARHAEKS